MADYNNFAQVLRDSKGTPDKRRSFVAQWLRETYAIDYNLNPQYFDEMTRPQAHDGQPPHFHRVQLPSTYGVVYAELAKDAFGKWRIAVDADPEFKSPTLLAEDESASQSQQNADTLNEYIAMLASPIGGTTTNLARVSANPDAQFGDLEGYANSAPTQDPAVESTVNAYDIPAYLFQPEDASLPGVRFSDLAKLAA
jgi:hypothetical protein